MRGPAHAVCVRGLVMLCSLSLATSASASPKHSVRLAYEAPSSCPTREELAAEIASRLGYQPISDSAGDAFSIAIAPSAGRLTATVRYPSGNTRVMRGSGADCRELGQAVALAVAMHLDPIPLEADDHGHGAAPAGPTTTASASQPSMVRNGPDDPFRAEPPDPESRPETASPTSCEARDSTSRGHSVSRRRSRSGSRGGSRCGRGPRQETRACRLTDRLVRILQKTKRRNPVRSRGRMKRGASSLSSKRNSRDA